jgi:Holliday junction resolvase RusA-like endonuclease
METLNSTQVGEVMQTEFFMAMEPPRTTHQEKQVKVVKGKPVFYEPADLKAARAKLQAYLAGHVPKEKYTGAVRLITKWLFPVTGKHKNGEWKTTKPDTDNMVKLLKDVMTELEFWKDDALVASEITEKFWSDIPGIYVKIEELGDLP